MKPHTLSTHWQLFLDNHLVERETGFDRRMHTPRKHGPIFPERLPWEQSLGFFMPVHDGKRFQALYRVSWPDPEVEAYHASLGMKGDPADVATCQETAYACSDDGIHWERPALQLCDAPIFSGGRITGSTRQNNVGVPVNFVWDLGRHGNVSDPGRRLLMRQRRGLGTPAGRSHHGDVRQPGPLCFAAELPDFTDAHWDRKVTLVEGTLAPRGFGNFAGWDEIHGEWIAFMQGARPRWFPSRDIARHWSPDFKSWRARSVLFPDAADPHTLEHYDECMEITVVRQGDLWLGFMAMFHSDRTSWEYCPPFIQQPNFEFAYDLPGYASRKGTTDVQLVTSRDGGHTWQRVAERQVWLPHGTHEDDFDRLTYVGTPITVGDTTYFYYLVRNGDHLNFRKSGERYYHDRESAGNVALATFKRDRYVSLSTGTFPAILCTRPLLLAGGELTINADATRGEIRVEVAPVAETGIDDLHGAPIAEYGLRDCQPILTNGVDTPVRWRQHSDISALVGRPVRLRFYVRNADLFGFRVAPAAP